MTSHTLRDRFHAARASFVDEPCIASFLPVGVLMAEHGETMMPSWVLPADAAVLGKALGLLVRVVTDKMFRDEEFDEFHNLLLLQCANSTVPTGVACRIAVECARMYATEGDIGDCDLALLVEMLRELVENDDPEARGIRAARELKELWTRKEGLLQAERETDYLIKQYSKVLEVT